jgi:hypothetical protein
MSGLLDDAELDAILAESVPPAEPTFVDMPFVAGEVVSAEEMVERLLQLSLTNKALREELAQYKLDQETRWASTRVLRNKRITAACGGLCIKVPTTLLVPCGYTTASSTYAPWRPCAGLRRRTCTRIQFIVFLLGLVHHKDGQMCHHHAKPKAE